jgi:hypothetical protein
MSLASSAAHAGTVVLTDSGSIGGFTITNEGVAGSVTSLRITGLPAAQSEVDTVNGVNITPERSVIPTPVTLTVTLTAPDTYSIGLTPPTYTQTIGGTAGSQAELNFNLTTGETSTLLPKFFNMSGLITQVLANANPNYDFTPFTHGGTQNVTLTATSFTGAGVSSFDSFFATPGATATGNGSFSQAAAVPEPASLVLLAIGMSGLVAFGRTFRKRPTIA